MPKVNSTKCYFNMESYIKSQRKSSSVVLIVNKIQVISHVLHVILFLFIYSMQL